LGYQRGASEASASSFRAQSYNTSGGGDDRIAASPWLSSFVAEDLEEAARDLVPLFGVDLLGEVHRALHVGEEDGDLLSLAFERAPVR
jgi:hypothetical protein